MLYAKKESVGLFIVIVVCFMVFFSVLGLFCVFFIDVFIYLFICFIQGDQIARVYSFSFFSCLFNFVLFSFPNFFVCSFSSSIYSFLILYFAFHCFFRIQCLSLSGYFPISFFPFPVFISFLFFSSLCFFIFLLLIFILCILSHFFLLIQCSSAYFSFNSLLLFLPFLSS